MENKENYEENEEQQQENHLNGIPKGKLAIILSKLKQFTTTKVRLEQYTTDSQIAADILTKANILGDFADKTVVDLGAGTGILGIGTLLQGAKQAIFVDVDNEALKIANENYQTIKKEHPIGNAQFINKNITEFCQKADTVVMNPPFGTKTEHADKQFLQTAFKTAPVIYSIHKTTTHKFIQAITQDNNYKITHSWDYEYPLKNTMKHHTKKTQKIQVTAYRLQQLPTNL